jgi:predicted RNase H-like HicB family nuclease
MDDVHDTIHVTIEYFTGFEEGEDDMGYPYYVASCDELVAVTDGRTWHDLMRNVHEMIEAHLEGEDTVKLYRLTPNPRIVIMRA